MSNQIKGVRLQASDFKSQQDGVYIDPVKIVYTPGMLLVWAEWCGHCQHFKPIFNEISKQMGLDFILASIEDTELQKGGKLASKLGVEGFPTIMFFNEKGKILETYNGERDKKSVLDNICKVYHKCITGK